MDGRTNEEKVTLGAAVMEELELLWDNPNVMRTPLDCMHAVIAEAQRVCNS